MVPKGQVGGGSSLSKEEDAFMAHQTYSMLFWTTALLFLRQYAVEKSLAGHPPSAQALVGGTY